MREIPVTIDADAGENTRRPGEDLPMRVRREARRWLRAFVVPAGEMPPQAAIPGDEAVLDTGARDDDEKIGDPLASNPERQDRQRQPQQAGGGESPGLPGNSHGRSRRRIRTSSSRFSRPP